MFECVDGLWLVTVEVVDSSVDSASVGACISIPACLWWGVEITVISVCVDSVEADDVSLDWAVVHWGGHSLEECCVSEVDSCLGWSSGSVMINVSESGTDTSGPDVASAVGRLGIWVLSR